MSRVTCGESALDLKPSETVLEALERAGLDPPSSCRAGQCQTCLHRAIEGTPPAAAQEGLTPGQKATGYFLACICVPSSDLVIVRPDDVGREIDAEVRAIDQLAPDIMRLRLAAERFDYRPGQFLELIARDDLRRHYSLASHPDEDDFLELHIRLHENGRMSGLLRNDIATGGRLRIAGPAGTCFYEGVDVDQPMTLIGAGTGLAPLYGILRDALLRGHRGPIRLYHGARHATGLYLRDELRSLAERLPRFDYRPCALDPAAPLGGDVSALALSEETNFSDTAFFLCGGENLVNRLKRDIFLRGASLHQIRADAFVPAG